MATKRYAAHYIHLYDVGFLKQYVVEVNEGRMVRFYPLTEEIESVEWMPGVIMIDAEASPYLLYPFDFRNMQPVAETQRTPLR